jgi:hypothetical protein
MTLITLKTKRPYGSLFLFGRGKSHRAKRERCSRNLQSPGQSCSQARLRLFCLEDCSSRFTAVVVICTLCKFA